MQGKWEQEAWLFLPLAGHLQTLHSSEAMKSIWGQHWSTGSTGVLGCGGTGSDRLGRVGHCSEVQLASLLNPLEGHTQVFNPSPAGEAMPGKQRSTGRCGPGATKHSLLVHGASLFKPLVGHVQVLHPSDAVKPVCGQH